MIRITDNLWIGDGSDGCSADLNVQGIGAVLNVAQDLQGTRGWYQAIEYMQVGLIDGPGNPNAAYHAVLLALITLLKRRKVLVYCHSGGRSLAVVLMYLHLTEKRGWDDQLEILREQLGTLPEVHEAHRAGFNKLQWRLLANVMED